MQWSLRGTNFFQQVFHGRVGLCHACSFRAPSPLTVAPPGWNLSVALDLGHWWVGLFMALQGTQTQWGRLVTAPLGTCPHVRLPPGHWSTGCVWARLGHRHPAVLAPTTQTRVPPPGFGASPFSGLLVAGYTLSGDPTRNAGCRVFLPLEILARSATPRRSARRNG